MSQQQLSIRSTRAKNLAHRLAKKEQRTISQVVERALEVYAKAEVPKTAESEADFWLRMHREHATDLDLQGVIDQNRKPHRPIDLRSSSTQT